ncbi:MAG: hypothetical protein U1E76_05915 [Planctomycetota bacterium]
MTEKRERSWSLLLFAAAVLMFAAQLPAPVSAAPAPQGGLCYRCWPSTPPTCIHSPAGGFDCNIWEDDFGWHCTQVGVCPP